MVTTKQTKVDKEASLGANRVAYANPLEVDGSAIWSLQLATGPFPVTSDCTYRPSMANIASRPFLISFSCSSDRVVGSSPKPRGSNESPGDSPEASPRGPP